MKITFSKLQIGIGVVVGRYLRPGKVNNVVRQRYCIGFVSLKSAQYRPTRRALRFN